MLFIGQCSNLPWLKILDNFLHVNWLAGKRMLTWGAIQARTITAHRYNYAHIYSVREVAGRAVDQHHAWE